MTDKAAQIKTLRRRRGTIQGTVTKLIKLLDDTKNRNYDSIKSALDLMHRSFGNFDAIQDELEELDEENELPQRDTILDLFICAEARANKFLRESEVSTEKESVKSGSTAGTSASVVSLGIPVNLPRINVPEFDGNIENWASFFDLFTSLVDKNPVVTSNVAKLQYLRSSMTDKAEHILDDIPTKEDHYQIAIDRLKSKFESPRRALRAHWANLRKYPKLERDTPASLGQLVECFEQNLRAMKNLGAPTAEWSVPIIDLVLTKIGPHTAWQWELTLDDKDNSMPSYTHLLKYLEKRANSVGLSNFEPGSKPTAKNSHQSKQKGSAANFSGKKSALNYSTTDSSKQQSTRKACPICSNSHRTYYCDKFKAMTLEARKQAAEAASLCMNCLQNHGSEPCRSKYHCKVCGSNTHNTLLCQSNPEFKGKKAQNYSINFPTSDLITTALIDVANDNKKVVQCRALLDTCSTKHFISENLVSKLGLKVDRDPCEVSFLNTVTTISRGTVTATIKSRCSGYAKELTFYTVDVIANQVPDQPIQRRKLKIPKNVELADTEFHQPAPADILVASGVTLSLFCQGQINLSKPGEPELILQKTLLGWVIGGSAPSSNFQSRASCHLTTLNDTLKKFWQYEELSAVNEVSSKCKTEEEMICEEHFVNNVTRNGEGRYVVALPFNEKIADLGASRSMAQKRLVGLKRKLSLNPELNEKYNAAMQEYLTLGHMTLAEAGGGENGYYLPHFPVIKESSLTTAVRPVFDGSTKTTTGLSLNDALRVGPTIQPDLFSQLLKFRVHAVVLTGDIEKMYRQFLVRKEDRKYQRILWFDAEGRDCTYELNTVTFGLAPASFLAIRCLHQLADDECNDFPLAARVLKEEFYVDNALTGASTISGAIQLREQLSEVLGKAQVNIYQWASNEPRVLEGLPPESVNKQLILNNSTINTLGLKWDSTKDCITYTVAELPINPSVTKRGILSEISKLFDPLGLLAPVIIFAKILIQELWKLELNWDESLPSHLRHAWLKYRRQLPLLDDLGFKRKILVDNPIRIELHGFGDAGERAYGCCIYVRSIDTGGDIQITLLCAKSRVAPIKSISIPRLELCAARILADLTSTVKTQIPITFDQTYHWTDSTVVLNWIHTYPSSLQVFVANRVAEIQTKSDVNDWSYVSTSDNPADLITRSQTPKNFLKCTIWQQGPAWLSYPENEWPVSKFVYEPDKILEKKKVQCFASVSLDVSIFEKFSCLYKLQKIVALCMRIKNKNKNDHVLVGAERDLAIKNARITADELHSALKTLIRVTQESNFGEEFYCLKKGKPVPSHSRILPLNPFLDKDGLIRVGGRLKNSALPFSQRHPILLPKSNYLTQLIIESEHKKHAHAGVQATLYALRRRFWVLDGRNAVRKILRKCVTCSRMKPLSADYLMGDLPGARVNPARPFSQVGIDLCGYFYLKEKKYRNRNQVKAYVVIFVCFATKAVHLELVTDLTSDSFIGALRRFAARRGFCSDIYSDNATNFQGANNQMKELMDLFSDPQHESKVSEFAAQNNLRWHFIPSKSPHVGGLWESAVKSFKHHLLRVVKGELFTYEEFYTFCTEIEAILNSRPISPMSSDPSDLLVLTPGHFLIGDSLTSLPDLELRDTPVNRLSRWQLIQQVKQHFWSRWQKEYLNELTVRSKWTKSVPSIKEGSLVLLKDDKLPPLKWVMGRVIQCHPGTDDVTRVVTVKTASGVFKRSVKNVAPLPIETSSSDDSTASTLNNEKVKNTQ